jgi:hypothetical protein
VAKCAAIDALRSQKGRDRLKAQYLLVNPSHPSTEDLYISEEQLLMACRAPAGASEECRQLWNMMFNDGLTLQGDCGKTRHSGRDVARTTQTLRGKSTGMVEKEFIAA